MTKYLKVDILREMKRAVRDILDCAGSHRDIPWLDNYISIEKNTGVRANRDSRLVPPCITPSGEIIVRAGCHTQYCVHSYSCPPPYALALAFYVGIRIDDIHVPGARTQRDTRTSVPVKRAGQVYKTVRVYRVWEWRNKSAAKIL